MLHFFRKNERSLVKALFYGLIVGFYFSFLFIKRDKLVQRGEGNTRIYIESTLFEYILEVVRTSIVISIGVFVITLIGLGWMYRKQK
ncbi:hypothetical protein [Oceanobacillus iheyensis HTE831]|uniref:Uncharacterized protein n=1 Tax=Oceanobacillus iheyensis (strain DSM 14371 / CIP 107618 / JCM 11309 / KCTC 3954 / HTE831) TaxID=221109 RepID=Q8EL88_OCEIH|nr:hypothetical protein [Oceanobacillus iheyensis HTE831]